MSLVHGNVSYNQNCMLVALLRAPPENLKHRCSATSLSYTYSFLLAAPMSTLSPVGRAQPNQLLCTPHTHHHHHHLMCSPPQRHHAPLLIPFLSSGPTRISPKRTSTPSAYTLLSNMTQPTAHDPWHPKHITPARFPLHHHSAHHWFHELRCRHQRTHRLRDSADTVPCLSSVTSDHCMRHLSPTPGT